MSARVQQAPSHPPPLTLDSNPAGLHQPPPPATGESKRDKKRREWVDKVETRHKDRMDDRDRMYIETHTSLSHLASSLLPIPPTSTSYLLSLYTLTLERDALLSQIDLHHEYRLHSSRRIFELERERLEDEYRRAREGVRNVLLDRVEERKRRLREERESGDVLDMASLPPLPSSQPSPVTSNATPSFTLAPTSTAMSASLSSSSNRKLRPSRALARGNSPPMHDNSDLPPISSLLTDDILSPAHLSLSILSHPSLSRSSTSALHNSPFAFASSSSQHYNPSGNGNGGNNGPPTKKSRGSGANGGGGGGGNGNGGNDNTNTRASASNANGSYNGDGGGVGGGSGGGGTTGSRTGGRIDPSAGGADDRIFTYIPGKSLLELGKLVKGSEAEVEGDLGEIRRSWRGGGGIGRGRRGAAAREAPRR